VKYAGIVLLKDKGHTVKGCCELLGVSSSSFYDWAKCKLSDRKKRDLKLKDKIEAIFDKSKKRYGSPRVQKVLQHEGEKVGKDKVAKIMKNEGFSATRKKAFRPTTTVNDPADSKSARIYKIEEHNVQRENEVWASDLTYIPTATGFSYLVVVMDLYNREIKGWDVSDSMEAVQTKQALMMAIKGSAGSLKGMIFHSDQGVQNCSSLVRGKLKFLEVKQSMSRKGNCYDNAFVESFFHSLKTELELKDLSGAKEVRKEIFEYINWYNRERLHSSLGYLSPMDYVKQTRLAA